MSSYTPADEKCLALNFAMTALVKSLFDQGHLNIDLFFKELAGAREHLERLGETGAANLLGSMAEELQRIG